MWPELGRFALIMAAMASVLQAGIGISASHRGARHLFGLVRGATLAQFAAIATAFGILIGAFVENDFSVLYVAQNSNSALPLLYRIAATWGAHEGSLLLWSLMLAGWSVAVLVARVRLQDEFTVRVLGVLGLISAGFYAFIIATSDPFLRLVPAAFDGVDLNPVLQDPALVAHPPMLYMGYVGFAVAFAFAIAAMLQGRVDQDWARQCRPWAMLAWCCLTVGIALGSWWAYYELGWGGYWFWDPVENASFMPWLVGTALIHSLAVTDKRGLFKSWTLLLAIVAFSLSLLGTFLVRSGVLVSVHSFAADPRRGIAILVFLLAVVGGALTLYAWRAPMLRSSAGFTLWSRESFLLFNNILLVVAAAAVFAGTLAPLIADALGQSALSVGPPYFNPIFLATMLPMLVLLAIGMHASWKQGQLRRLRKRILLALGLALILALLWVLTILQQRMLAQFLVVALGVWIVCCACAEPLLRLVRRQSLTREILGMAIAHIGVGLFVLAIGTVETGSQQRDVALALHETALVDDVEFRYVALQERQGNNFDAMRATLELYRNGRRFAVLYPEKRNYWVQRQVMTEAGIETHNATDYFAALGDDLGGGRYSFRLQIRPLINLVWLAALVMAAGGALAVSGLQARRTRSVAAATPDISAADRRGAVIP
ncbi:MAG: heme lyase CcmF/NrfE family subunit [Steroidobacteraceae bacterium]